MRYVRACLFRCSWNVYLFSACLLGSAGPAIMATEPGQTPQKLTLWSGQRTATGAAITVYHAPNQNGAAIVICPGGGYGAVVAEPEGHGIARWLNKHGITGIVLEYELPRGRSFVPLRDVQRALRTTRANATMWKLDGQRIGVMGFSAGGHLASSAGTHFDRGDPQAADSLQRVSCRPDFMILIYPVITMGAPDARRFASQPARDPAGSRNDRTLFQRTACDETDAARVPGPRPRRHRRGPGKQSEIPRRAAGLWNRLGVPGITERWTRSQRVPWSDVGCLADRFVAMADGATTHSRK